ncbi:hypothetical protein DVR12_23820 [Chitinophaga silvatica]|uniref:PDZ domain-containing protein n=1 Tax=Chitinophaga silvatica TaxID=2282649 RepID=A0A3E1Y3J3_9BACT|nr:carboxy terminal-processing peptidase [Chitinophaga silvatica]RFS19265.1 hypothetical protein DVR12_23820 [Chitinophaga silvatica]
MKMIERNKWLLLTGAVLTGNIAYAQVPTDAAAIPAFRSGTITSVMAKIKKGHFDPKPLDDAYATTVWKQYLQSLDQNGYIFLQEDLDQLATYKQKIDDELKVGSTAFFDATMKIYFQRLHEINELYPKLLAQPFDYDKQESILVTSKELRVSANKEERTNNLRKRLKYLTLNNYQESIIASGDTTKLSGAIDVAREQKSRDKIKKQFEVYFKKMFGENMPNELFNQYVAFALLEIDPHTSFSGPKDKSFEEAITKRYYGLGMELGVKDLDFFVKRLMPGGSAFRSGLVKENDNILSISNSAGEMMSLTGLEATEVAAMIRGDKGTEIKLTLQTPGEKAREVKITRDEVKDIDSKSKSAVIEKDGKKFGYIYLPLFYTDPGNQLGGCAADIYSEVEKLKQNEVEGIVMDLRGNGGGSLDEVVKMTGAFMNEGPVSWLKDRERINRYGTNFKSEPYEGPLTVLTDESSASASEIFTAVMQDRGRAIILGANSTFGKGTAQIPVNVGKMGDPDKGIADISFGTIRLTTQKFYRVNGSSTQLKGVTPDIKLQDRMNFQAIMEKDYPSAMQCDSVVLQPYEHLKFPFDYNQVIVKAKQRVQNNTAYAKVEDYTKKLKALSEEPTPLDLASYRKNYKLTDGYKKGIQQAKDLPTAQFLKVTAATFRNVNPSTVKDPVSEIPSYKDFLERVKKDIYINESISVLEDMINGTKH